MPNTHKYSTKRKTVHVTLWTKPEIKTELSRLAQLNELSVSQTGGAFLEQALRQNLHEQHAALLQPMIKQAIREELRAFGNRLVFFLMRIAFASEQARILITNVLDRILRREAVTQGFSKVDDPCKRLIWVRDEAPDLASDVGNLMPIHQREYYGVEYSERLSHWQQADATIIFT